MGGIGNIESEMSRTRTRTRCDATRGTCSREILGVHPGPDRTSVLTLQQQHRSEAIWDGQVRQPLFCRHHHTAMWQLHDDVRSLVHKAGFYGICQIGHIPLDHALLTALVDRWRQETHTFHLPVGEMTVTLQDVALLLGLRIDGHAVTGGTAYDWYAECHRLLGVRPDDKDIIGSSLRLRWLSQQFSQSPDVVDQQTSAYHARAYILYLIGSVLFTDSSGDTVQLMFLPLLDDLARVSTYSWGSATLAYLYRSLCRATRQDAAQLGGNLLLLQLWAWERLHIGRPETRAVEGAGPEVDPAWRAPLGARWIGSRTFVQNPVNVLTFYRDQLDQQTDHQVLWLPYTFDRLATAPPECLDGQEIWRARVPLICFAYVEWHFPDRVLRQFKMLQDIPKPSDTSNTLHAVDRRGRYGEDWLAYHHDFVDMWDQRAHHVVGKETDDPSATMRYMSWYHSITRRRIAPPINPTPAHPRMEYEPSGSATHRLVELVVSVSRRCVTGICDTTDDAARALFTDILASCRSGLEDVGEGPRLQRELRELEPPIRRRPRSRGKGRRGRGQDTLPPPPPEDPSQLTHNRAALPLPGPLSTHHEAGPSAPPKQRRKRSSSRR